MQASVHGVEFSKDTPLSFNIQYSQGALRAERGMLFQRGFRAKVSFKGCIRDFYMIDARCVETSHCKVKWQLRVSFGASAQKEARVFHEPHAHDRGFVGHSKLFAAQEVNTAAVYQRSCHGGGMRVDGLIQAFHLIDIDIFKSGPQAKVQELGDARKHVGPNRKHAYRATKHNAIGS